MNNKLLIALPEAHPGYLSHFFLQATQHCLQSGRVELDIIILHKIERRGVGKSRLIVLFLTIHWLIVHLVRVVFLRKLMFFELKEFLLYLEYYYLVN